nr:hypothetical protein [Tanacetum cinerariifolium]
MNEFCEEKGIKREYSMARTPLQNRVAERRNRTLIEAARTMLADCGGLEWLFDIDALSNSMNYTPVSTGTTFNDFAGKGANFDADGHNKDKHGPSQASESDNQERPNAESSTKPVNTVRPVNTTTPTYADYPNDPLMPDLEDVRIFDDAYDDRDKGAEADYNKLVTMKPKKVIQTLDDESWVEAMQKELLQFKLLNVWILVDLPHEKRAIGTKWVYRNKKDQRGVVVRNKARLIEAISLFLSYALFMDFIVYQMDVKSAFLYGTIEEEVYVIQPLGFVDLEFLDRVYKIKNDILLVQVYVDDIIFGSTKRSLSIKFEQLMHKRFKMSSMAELTFFLGLQCKSTSTPMETHKPLSKDAARTDVDVYLCRSMIGLLMYLTSSRPDIMFAMYACSRFQVQPKVSHMHVVKRIYRYLKGQPTLGLWYPKDSPLELVAYSDSDYAGDSIDRKSTIREYIAASNCYGQVLWLQNQLLDYGYNFMQTKIHVDNKNAICVVKNHVYHSKTKHIEIRHHFIRDSYEKRLIEMVKIHTDYNKSDDNTEFHQIVDFLSSCSINYALTVYVDDIIFGSTKPRYTQLFDDLMKSHFEMSMMGEMTFFLGLKVNQSPHGIFINQSNYVLEILKKYEMETCDPDSYFELIGFSYADYAGCKDIFKSTSDGTQFLGGKMVSWSSKKQDCMSM